MRWWTCLAILCIVAATIKGEASQAEWLEVNTAQGPVRGRRDPNGGLFVFYNIPYATAPTGKDKFKAPLPPPTWTEPLDAINRGIMCPQFIVEPLIPEYMTAQEDCLIANVFVPDTKEKNLPVLVYFYGGGFQIGISEWLPKKNLMKNKDIIVVNFNYRLGMHGFLCLGTEDIPGNAGLKDQVALLHWVQQNIAAFGGNPNDVTIDGSSAGSLSVDLLMISKTTEGLFHKVIPESGSNLGAPMMQFEPLKNAKDHARKLNFTNVDDIYALEEFYATLPYEVMIVNAFMDRADSIHMFVPCIERDTGDRAIITEPPLNILKRGDYKKVPLLYGFTNMEGLLAIDSFDFWKDQMNEKLSDFFPADLEFESEAEKEEVDRLVKEFYFGDQPVNNDNILAYVDFFSDVFYTYSSLRAVKFHIEAGHNQVYLYEYSFVDEDVPVVPHTNVRGAEHCAQSMAVGDGRNITHTSEDDITEEFRNMKKIIREMWLNFIKTGEPVPKGSSTLPLWPPVRANASPYMSLGKEVKLLGALLEERFLFWENIYQKYNKQPTPPPPPPPRSHPV